MMFLGPLVDYLLAFDSFYEGISDLVVGDVGELIALSSEALDVVAQSFSFVVFAIHEVS